MKNKHGDFIWYELMTTDADAAQNFYGGLTGWTFRDSGQKANDYRLFSGDGSNVGGLLALTPPMIEAGAAPMWMGYICVDDVDSTAAAIAAAGGQILLEPWDVAEAGRMAIVADPQGAAFYISHPQTDYKSESFALDSPKVGHCGWNELCTSDAPAAESFYGEMFGWAHSESIDMGPAGTYKLYSHGDDRDSVVSGIMPKPDEMPVSLWGYYFRVESIDAALNYVKANGGSVMMGPMEVPGGDLVFTGFDPQGAMFSALGSK